MNLPVSNAFLILLLFIVKLFLHLKIENPDKNLDNVLLNDWNRRFFSFKYLLPIKNESTKEIRLLNLLIKIIYFLFLIFIPICVFSFYKMKASQ